MAVTNKSATELVTEFDEVYQFCEQQYMKEWKAVFADEDAALSDGKKESLRRNAQRAAGDNAVVNAIDKAFLNTLVKYPDLDEEIIWALISIAHELNLAQLDEFGLSKTQQLLAYERCISAHQSWN